MEINEVHADAIYEEMREERAGVNEFTGIERPAPLPPMSPFGPDVEEEDEEEDEDYSLEDEYRDKGMSRSDFYSGF